MALILVWLANKAHSTTARPAILVFDLAGASRTTEGTIRGRALGNVFNHADTDDITQSMLGPQVGRVHIFTEHAYPTTTKPFMVLKHDICKGNCGGASRGSEDYYIIN